MGPDIGPQKFSTREDDAGAGKGCSKDDAPRIGVEEGHDGQDDGAGGEAGGVWQGNHKRLQVVGAVRVHHALRCTGLPLKPVSICSEGLVFECGTTALSGKEKALDNWIGTLINICDHLQWSIGIERCEHISGTMIQLQLARRMECLRTRVTVCSDLGTAGRAGRIAQAAGCILVQVRPSDPVQIGMRGGKYAFKKFRR